MCATLGMSIVGSWFRRSDIHRWTWISNDGSTRKEIDHILSRCRQDFISYRILRGAESTANTDHRLVVATVRVDLCTASKKSDVEKKFDSELLAKDQSLQSSFELALRNQFDALVDLPDDVEQCWNVFRDNVVTVAKKVIGHKTSRRKPWLSQEADQLIALKRSAVNRGDKPERNRLKQAFRMRALTDKERYYNDIADDAELALKRNDMKPIYRAVKRISGKLAGDQQIFPKKANGIPCQSEDEALLRWTEYYEGALNHPQSHPCPDLDALSQAAADDPDVRCDAPSIEEVRAAIMKLKNELAAGSDGISAKLLKYSVSTSSRVLHKLIGSIWRAGRVPAEWRDGIIVSLYKVQREQRTSHQ